MYKNFFGFKERPFQLVPNPAYLFLSKSHEEALAHLTYAVSQGDGFVEITGEVGTGKTTLCRVFLENLDKETEAAYIFNPRLDSVQLLKTINEEFDIPAASNNSKDLIDTLNGFLMQKRTEGKKVILLIDEAQNLSMDILEQLRLLSNLETNTSKLLQIILVGQPELGQMLDSHELRQLGQRITLSCHLSPLNFHETRNYIHHRIQIASRKPGVRLTLSAYYAIHRFSGGIPRLINIACDRAFLTAYGLGRHKITGGIAKMAIRELAGRGDRRRFALSRGRMIGISAVLGVLIGAAALLGPDLAARWAGGPGPDMAPAVVAHVAPPPGEAPSGGVAEPLALEEDMEGEDDLADLPAPDVEPAEPPVGPETSDAVAEPPAAAAFRGLEDYLMQAGSGASRLGALKAAVSLWRPEVIVSPGLASVEEATTFFRIGARQNGLLIHRVEGADLPLLRRLNLPAILEMYPPGGDQPVYAAVEGMAQGVIYFAADDPAGQIRAEPHEVETYWPGVAYIPWRDFFDFSVTIPKDASDESIINLKMLLQEIGFSDIGLDPSYDDATRRAVEIIQERHGIVVDGVVGPRTKIILYNELPNLRIPHLANAS